MERKGKHGKMEGRIFDYEERRATGLNGNCYVLYKHYSSEVTKHIVLDGYESAIWLANGEAFRLQNSIIDNLLERGVSRTRMSGRNAGYEFVLRLK